jgi:hypothetical protein
MVHPGGFEPPTARFVAEYSIQLSYGCIKCIYCSECIKARNRKIAEDGYSIALLLGQRHGNSLAAISGTRIFLFGMPAIGNIGEYGASRRIRTSDRSVRSRVLYPAELWMH